MHDWKNEEEWFPCGSAELIKIIFSLRFPVFPRKRSFLLSEVNDERQHWRERKRRWDWYGWQARKKDTKENHLLFSSPFALKEKKQSHGTISAEEKENQRTSLVFPLCAGKSLVSEPTGVALLYTFLYDFVFSVPSPLSPLSKHAIGGIITARLCLPTGNMTSNCRSSPSLPLSQSTNQLRGKDEGET